VLSVEDRGRAIQPGKPWVSAEGGSEAPGSEGTQVCGHGRLPEVSGSQRPYGGVLALLADSIRFPPPMLQTRTPAGYPGEGVPGKESLET
jgi:hypothetical protein